MARAKKKSTFIEKEIFGPLLGTQVKHISFLKHSVRGALRNRPANVITKVLLGISDHLEPPELFAPTHV